VGSFQEARELAQRTLDDARGVEDAATIAEASASLGQALDHLGDYPAARKAMEESYFAARDSEHHEAEALAAEQLTFIVGVRLEDYDEGLLWAKNAKVALSKTGGPLGKLLGNEASILDRKGDFEAAIEKYEEALKALTHEDADAHALGVTHMRLADALRAHGQHQEAITHYRETVKLWREAFGDDHPYVPVAQLSLATGLSAAGRNADAIVVFEQAIAALTAALGEDHPNVGVANINLGIALRKTGDLEGARQVQLRALEITSKAFGPDHRKTGHRLDALGRTLAALGDFEGAMERHREAIRIFEATLEPGHPDVLLARLNLADDLRLAGRGAEAAEAYEGAWLAARQHAAEDVPERWMAATYFGRALVEGGERERAAPVLEQALEHLAAMRGLEDVQAVASFAMAKVLWADPAQRQRAMTLAQSARGKLPDDDQNEALEAWLEHPG
jgi:tetratricopeptide (TPR) repeat protein